tara:strand:+ start:109 stop:600 length:492 start_codon:yes stop_codon:yes gene_type:complete
MKDAIICDVDGTVALMMGKRSPFEYHKADMDEPNQPVIDTVLTMAKAHKCKLIMLSARENVELNTPSTDNKHSHTYVNEKYDDLASLTRCWLNTHLGENMWHQLIMRTAGDYRKDCYVKYDIYNNYIAPRYNVKYVFDDRNQVVDMWRNGLGLTCFQVADGNF